MQSYFNLLTNPGLIVGCLVALQAKVRAVVVVVNRTRDRLQTRGLPLGSIKIRLEYLKQRIVRRVKLKVKVK